MSSSTVATKNLSKIWVQLGCNRNSRGLLIAPRVATGTVKLQPVTAKMLSGSGRRLRCTLAGNERKMTARTERSEEFGNHNSTHSFWHFCAYPCGHCQCLLRLRWRTA